MKVGQVRTSSNHQESSQGSITRARPGRSISKEQQFRLGQVLAGQVQGSQQQAGQGRAGRQGRSGAGMGKYEPCGMQQEGRGGVWVGERVSLAWCLVATRGGNGMDLHLKMKFQATRRLTARPRP